MLTYFVKYSQGIKWSMEMIQGWIKTFRCPERLKDFEAPFYRVITSTQCTIS